jgi:hypothetical protein
VNLSTLKVRGREYVLVPLRQYERLTAAEADRRDAARAHKALSQFRAGKFKTLSHEEVKRRLNFRSRRRQFPNKQGDSMARPSSAISRFRRIESSLTSKTI